MTIHLSPAGLSASTATPCGPVGAGGSAAASPEICPRQVDPSGDAVVLLPSGTPISLVRDRRSDARHSALESVLAHRQEQLRMGYTPEADDAKPMWSLLNLIELLARDVREAWPNQRDRQHLPTLRKFAVKLVATGLALIERIDREQR